MCMLCKYQVDIFCVFTILSSVFVLCIEVLIGTALYCQKLHVSAVSEDDDNDDDKRRPRYFSIA